MLDETNEILRGLEHQLRRLYSNAHCLGDIMAPRGFPRHNQHLPENDTLNGRL